MIQIAFTSNLVGKGWCWNWSYCNSHP